MANRIIVRDRACKQCGISPITGTKFCSMACCRLHRYRAMGARPRALVNAERREAAMRTCCVCGKRYLNNTSSKGYCCSRKCGSAILSRRAKDRQATTEAAHHRAYMAAKAELIRWANPNRIGGYATRIIALRKRIERKGWVCVTCATPVEQSFTGRKFYCSKACRPIDPGLKAKHRRIAKAKRRARKRGANCEPVDPFKVFERDGWMCHLCGCKTDRTKRGTPHPRAPELDHVVPLAKGGPHNYANTACACRKCNYTKGDRILGQPSLLAA